MGWIGGDGGRVGRSPVGTIKFLPYEAAYANSIISESGIFRKFINSAVRAKRKDKCLRNLEQARGSILLAVRAVSKLHKIAKLEKSIVTDRESIVISRNIERELFRIEQAIGALNIRFNELFTYAHESTFPEQRRRILAEVRIEIDNVDKVIDESRHLLELVDRLEVHTSTFT